MIGKAGGAGYELDLMDAAITPLNSKAFRDAMAKVPTAVHIVATDGPAGRTGLTASAVASVSANPPTLLICVNHSSRSNAILKANGVFSVNALRATDVHLSEVFAGRTDAAKEARFDSGVWTTMKTGAPVLSSALVSFDCRITHLEDVATHTVMFAQVVAVSVAAAGEARSLMYQNRAYVTLP